jgi:transcription antitermination factor NusG
MPDPRRWYALSVRSRKEKAAARDLLERGAEVYLPTKVELRPWSDRVKRVEIALFPGYLFVHTRLTAAGRVALLRTPFVHDFVGRLPGNDRIALEIPDVEIESVRTLVESARLLHPVDRLVRGTPIRVVGGPLRGAQGIVVSEADGRRQLVAQIALLGRGVRTHLSAEDVVEGPAADARRRAGESVASPGKR